LATPWDGREIVWEPHQPLALARGQAADGPRLRDIATARSARCRAQVGRIMGAFRHSTAISPAHIERYGDEMACRRALWTATSTASEAVAADRSGDRHEVLSLSAILAGVESLAAHGERDGRVPARVLMTA